MENTIITINKEIVQTEAILILKRTLTREEYEEVSEEIIDNITLLVQDSILKVIDFNNMLKRNKGAEKLFPHYKTYWRNENAYQSEFKLISTFKNQEDALRFIRDDFIDEFDEWKITITKKNNTEQEIHKINC